jgi:hypothetical protein
MRPLSARSFFFVLIGGSLVVIAAGVVLFMMVLTRRAPGSREVAISRSYRPGISGSPLRLVPGTYRTETNGLFARIIVLQAEAVLYDFWRVAPNGRVEDLHYSLISPTGRPIESERYVVMENGKACGKIGLSVYREAGVANPTILIVTYNGVWLPFASGGLPSTEGAFLSDRRHVAKLRAEARRPRFYRSLDARSRIYLSRAVPNC